MPNAAPVKQSLNALEGIITTGVAERDRILARFPEPSIQKVELLDALRVRVQTATRSAKAAIDQQFAALRDEARQYVADVRQRDSLTADYSAYLTELTALAPLVALMSEDQARTRLEGALNDKRYPAARALAELVSVKFGEAPTGRIALVLHRADVEAKTADMQAAEALSASLDAARQAWGFAAAYLEDWLVSVFDNMKDDWRTGYYRADTIFAAQASRLI